MNRKQQIKRAVERRGPFANGPRYGGPSAGRPPKRVAGSRSGLLEPWAPKDPYRKPLGGKRKGKFEYL